MSEERKWYRVECRHYAATLGMTIAEARARASDCDVLRVVELVDGPEVKPPPKDTFADVLERVAKRAAARGDRPVTDTELIDRMEAVRAANNVNWMALVRLALRVAPEEARPILAGITAKDAEIADIIKQLAEPR